MKRTGDDYFDSEEFSNLLEDYEEAVNNGQPVLLDADELTDIADYYHFTGDIEKADEAIEHALSLNPGATSPLVYKIREALAEEDITKAEALLDEILDKNDPEYFYMRAEVLVAQNKIDEADHFLRDYFKTVDADEYNDFVLDVANIYLDYGVNDKAYEWMMRSKGNDSPDFKELMGHVMFGVGKFKDSQRIFNELLDRNPYSTRYWNALANAQFMNEDYGESVTSSEYALAIDPNDADSMLTKANGLYRLNNYEEALKYYQRYEDLMPGFDFNQLQMGICLLNMNRVDEAIEHLKKARELTTEESEYQIQIYQELAFAYSTKGMLKQAMDCLDKTEDMDCDHNDMEVLRGHIMLENGRIAEAEESFKKAIMNSGNAPTVLLRIIVSLYDNKYVEATYTMFQKFFEVVGDDFNDGYSYMALCCWDLKYYDEFLKYLKEAIRRNPHEARVVLAGLFPEGMETEEYYDYMKDRIQS